MTSPRPCLHAATLAAIALVGASLQAQNQTTRASVATGGIQADASSNRISVAPFGRFVSFESNATNLVPGDLNFVQDIFVHDLLLGATERVSVGPAGLQANGESKRSALSGDGNRVVFLSLASNLVANDFNLLEDIFVRDRATATTTRVSVSSAGIEGNGLSTRAAISTDGTTVAFRSLASNLVPNDFNMIDDIFVRELATGVTTRVSVSSAGLEGNATSDRPTISADGSRIAFWSDADNLVAGDTPLTRDIFLHDRTTGITSLVSRAAGGGFGNGPSSRSSISDDGRYIAFTSDASNLVPGDLNLAGDVFVYDTLTGAMELISVSSAGVQGNALASVPAISGDARFVAYRSIASNLVPNDYNNTEDVFLFDRQTRVTTLVSLNDANGLGNGLSTRPSITVDGSLIAYQSLASNLVLGDTNLVEDVFVHDGAGGLPSPSRDLILLVGPSQVVAGTSGTWSWSQAPALAPWWLAYSFSLGGSIVAGHPFDLRQPATVAAAGLTSALGTGTYSSPPIPVAMIGRTAYLEVASRDGAGNLADSNALAVTFQ